MTAMSEDKGDPVQLGLRVRQWLHFSCQACATSKDRRFTSRDAEYEAAVRWMEDHPPGVEHGLGGFVRPSYNGGGDQP